MAVRADLHSVGFRAAASSLIGCGALIGTIVGAPAEVSNGPVPCRGDSYYHLSKTVLEVQVRQAEGRRSSRRPKLLALGTRVVADRKNVLCLDFLSAGSSAEQIELDRTPDGLLRRIGHLPAQPRDPPDLAPNNFSLDSSARPPSLGLKVQGVEANFEFDPFDSEKAPSVAESLREFGLCLVVDGYSFDSKQDTAQSYCRNPRRTMRRNHARQKRHDIGRLGLTRQAVYYRPREAHRIHVFAREGFVARWRLQRSETMMFENAAPVFAIAPDPKLFTARQAMLTFTDGVPSQVTVLKQDQDDALIRIPLGIVQAIVQVPAQIIELRVGRGIPVEKNLIAAQKELLRQLNQTHTTLDRPVASTPHPPPAPARRRMPSAPAPLP